MASHDPSDDYDGGWESGLDGGEVLPDVLLGPAHPYDRPDHYTPAHRWGTRHEVVSRPFADPIECLESDDGLDEVPAASPRDRPRPAPSRTRVKRKRRLSPAAVVKPSREERAVRVAAELGWTLDDLRDFRRRLAQAQAATTAVKGKAARDEAVARRLDVGVNTLGRLRAAESRAVAPPPRPAKRDLTSIPRTQDEMVAVMTSLSHRLTSKAYPARFFEAGFLLGMTRDEVMRAVDNRVAKSKPVQPKPLKPRPPKAARPAGPPGRSPRPQAQGPAMSKKQQRLALIAGGLGIPPAEVSRFRALRAHLSSELKGLAPPARWAKLAAEVQWPFQRVADLEQMETAALPKGSQVPAAPQRPKRPAATKVTPSTNFCPACGCRVAVTGWCRCS